MSKTNFSKNSTKRKYDPSQLAIYFCLILFAIIGLTYLFSLPNQQTLTQEQREGRVAGTAWYDSGWQYRKKITIDHSQVDANLTDFPILINQDSDAGLQAHAQVDADDILFTQSDGTTQLSHQIENYDDTDGSLRAWVKMPTLSSSSDSEIYLYYGNGSCSSQENITDVWSNGYAGVWLMNEGEGTIVNDYSGNNNDGTMENMDPATDWVEHDNGYALDFDGANDYLDVMPIGLSGNNENSISLTMRSSQLGTNKHLIDFDNCGVNDEGEVLILYNGVTKYGHWGNSSMGSTVINDNHWYGLFLTYDKNNMKLFVNGGIDNQYEYSNLDLVSESTRVAGYKGGGYLYDGQISQVLISSTARSAGWISTSYNNQNSPSTFYTLEGEEDDTDDPVNPTSFNGWETASKSVGISSGDWNNDAFPHFEWSGASDPTSSVEGYYLYFGTDSNADPTATSGIIEDDSSPHLSTNEQYTLDKSMTSGDTYYFRLSTLDTSGNTGSIETMFAYGYDPDNPDQVEYINVSPAGCSTSESFDFSWNVPADTGGSGVSHYQYKLGSTGSISTNPDTTLTASSYQNLDNVLYLRAVDNAGNKGTWQTGVYCSIRDAELIDGPTVESEPGSLIISWRSDKDTSSFVKVYQGNQYVGQLGQSTLDTDHSVRVIGLEPSTKYRYKLVWTDENGNIGHSDWFKTQTAPPPQVKNLKAQVLNQQTAVISFDTTKPTLATIRYGKSKYNKEIDMGSNLAQTYSYKVSNLEADSIYQFSVRARIDSGYQFDSEKYIVETPPYPSINNLQVKQLKDRPSASVKVTWSTNVKTSSALTLTPTDGSKAKTTSSANLSKDHSLTVEGLLDSREYQAVASGRDQYGNSTQSSAYSFETPPDSRPPKIFNVKLETSINGTGSEAKAQIVISWQTDEPATSQVEYGIGVGGDSYQSATSQDSSLSKNHTVIISQLDPQRTYHLRALSEDSAGNLTKGNDNVIITGKAQESVLDIIIGKLKETFGFLANIRETLGWE